MASLTSCKDALRGLHPRNPTVLIQCKSVQLIQSVTSHEFMHELWKLLKLPQANSQKCQIIPVSSLVKFLTKFLVKFLTESPCVLSRLKQGYMQGQADSLVRVTFVAALHYFVSPPLLFI